METKINPNWTSWTYNVVDKYKGMSVEAIKSDLDEKAFPYAVLIENWQGDFNLGSCVRNANAFGAKKVFYIGKKRYDRRSTVGTYNYTEVTHLSSIEELTALYKDYTFIGVDNIAGSVPVESFVWPKSPLMIFGEEGCGLTPDMVKMCESLVSITQYGSVRSLNAGCASGIIMHDYVNKFNKLESK